MPHDPSQEALLDHREEIYNSLVQAIAGGAVLFVGAGSSSKVGYPMWGGLLSKLENAARHMDDAATTKVAGVDGLLRASAYKKILGVNEYHRIICEAFAPRVPQHHAGHESLVAMPFRHVFTTNYDGVLQSAHHKVHGSDANSFDADEWEKLSDLRQRQAAHAPSRSYVHLHGSLDRPHGIVLCKEEYDQRYHQDRRYKEFLKEFLVGQRLVFVGFSLSDEEFKYVLREVEGSLLPSGPRHFAILAAPSDLDEERIEAANLKGKYGIEPVYFDNSGGDFSGLWALIERLRSDVDNYKSKNGLVPAAALEDLVADLFTDDPDRRREALQRLPNLVSSHSITSMCGDTGSGTGSDIDLEIDAVFKLVKRGFPDDAIAKYEAIQARGGDKLTARHRYRLEANIGNALYSKGEAELASQAYLRAVGHYRESRDAKGIELLGVFLRGDMAETRRLACDLFASEPSYGHAWSIWIRTHGDGSDFNAIEAEVPVSLLNDPEVAHALSILASQCDQLDAHVAYARTAAEASPEWEEALALLGAAILASERRFIKFHADLGMVPAHPELIKEAEKTISKAVDAFDPRAVTEKLAGLYFNRSVARRLLGNEAGAAADLQEAFRRYPSDPTIALGYAMEAGACIEIDLALEALSKLPSDGDWADQVQLAGVMLRLRRRMGTDVELARAHVEELLARLGHVEPAKHRADIVRIALRVCHEQRRSADGPGIVASIPNGILLEHERLVLLAQAHLQAGSREAAIEIAQSALLEFNDDFSWFDLREAAELAEACGMYSEAVRLWQKVLSPDDTSSDTVNLIRAAYFAGEWRIVLDVCDTVRVAGRTKRQHLEVEIEVLAASREVARAISLINDWIKTHPKDKNATLSLSVLALRDNKPEMAVFDELRLPSVPDIRHVDEGVSLVNVLRRGPVPERALDVAYALYRRFPEHSSSHCSLFYCVFDPSASPLSIKRHQRVEDGAAVLVRRQNEQPYWVYIESLPEPALSRNEFPPSHDFIQAMWGLVKGDWFDYLDRPYEVVATENRILRRVHDIMEHYEENFPDKPMVRRFSVPSDPPPEAPIEEKLGEVYRELKREESQRELLESMYRENRLPIAAFATMLGRRVFDVVRYLASDRTMGVRADDGEATRWPVALAAASRSEQLVLDGTVLAGAIVLDLLSDYSAIGVKLIVPQAVLDELRELSLEAGGSHRSMGRIGLDRGEFFFVESSPEEVAAEVSRIERVIQFVQSHCEVVGGAATLRLPKGLKKKLDEYLDTTSIDAVAIAKDRDATLWTDDLGLQRVLDELGADVSVVWTQAVCRAARDKSRISADRYEQILGRLVDRGYVFTRLSAGEMVAILSQADWQTDRGLGAAIISVVSDVALVNPHNRLIVAIFILGVWTECPRRERAKEIIVSVLDKVGRERSQIMLARFIFRFPNERGLNLFNDHTGRALKRFLRSWRSRDGEFKSRRSRGRRSHQWHQS